MSLNHGPSRLEFWWHAHQKKGDGGYISPEAERIDRRFEDLVVARSSQRGDTLIDDSTRVDKEIEDWLQATGGPKKGRVVGIPHVPAYTLVPVVRSRRCPPTGGSGCEWIWRRPFIIQRFLPADHKGVHGKQSCAVRHTIMRADLLAGSGGCQRLYRSYSYR